MSPDRAGSARRVLGADNSKPDKQIGRKLTIGLREALEKGSDFCFIRLDIARAECPAQLNPGVSLENAMKKASGFGSKWLTSYWFHRWKYGHPGNLKPLQDLRSEAGLAASQALHVADRIANMGGRL